MSWSESEKLVLPLTMLVIIALTIVSTLLLKNKSYKTKKIFFMALATLMLVLEVIKQLRAFPNYGFWNLPLHFSSTFMFWWALGAYAKGKKSELGFTMAVTSSFVFALLFYFNPSSIIGSSADNILRNYSSFHTFVYHHMFFYFSFMIMALGFYKPSIKQLKGVVIAYSTYAIIAITFSHLLNENYTNMLRSNISFMQTFLDNAGYIPYTAVMYLIGLTGLVGSLLVSIKVKDKTKNIKLKLIKEV